MEFSKSRILRAAFLFTSLIINITGLDCPPLSTDQAGATSALLSSKQDGGHFGNGGDDDTRAYLARPHRSTDRDTHGSAQQHEEHSGTDGQPYVHFDQTTEEPEDIRRLGQGSVISKRHRCGLIDSCYGRCGSTPSDGDSLFRYLRTNDKSSSFRTSYLCFCDVHCKLYGDCCQDLSRHCQFEDMNFYSSDKDDPIAQTSVIDSDTSPEQGNNQGIPTSRSVDATSGPQAMGTDNKSYKHRFMECTQVDEVEGGTLFVRTKCHNEWTNRKIEEMCYDTNFKDDVARLFVQGEDGITYRNIYCAQCNFISKFRFWILDAYCYGDPPASVWEEPSKLSEYLVRKCVTKFRVPFGQIQRPCLQVVDRCPKNSMENQIDSRLAELCEEGHQSLVAGYIDTTPDRNESMLFRNSFCAECNGFFNNTVCPTLNTLQKHYFQKPRTIDSILEGLREEYGEGKSTSRVVTNYNADLAEVNTVIYQADGLLVPIVETCQDGMVFDPYIGKCRQLHCSDGYVLIREDCVPVKATDNFDDDDVEHFIDQMIIAINNTIGNGDEIVLTIKLFIEWDASGLGDKHNIDDVGDRVPGWFVPTLPPISNDTSLEVYIIPVSPYPGQDMNLYEVTITCTVDSPSVSPKNATQKLILLTKKLANLKNTSEYQVYINDVCVKTYSTGDWLLQDVFSGNVTDLNYLINRCKNGNLTALRDSEFIVLAEDSSTDQCPVLYVNHSGIIYNCHDNYIFSYDFARSSDQQKYGALVCDTTSPLDFSCEKLLLNETEYELLPNGSMITQDGVRYTANEYFITTEGAEVCNPHTNVVSETIVVFFDFSQPQLIMTNIGFILSTACLVITLVTYAIFKELRTLPGLNQMSLMAASIGGNISFLIGLTFTPGSPGCQTIAIFTHFFFLARLSWTNAILIHAFHTFGPKTRRSVHRSLDILRPNRSNARTRIHLLYALYAWGTAAAIVTIGMAWHFCACGPLPVYYGIYFSCWIADPAAFIYLFILPLGVVLFANTVLYIPTVCSMQHSRRSSLRKLPDNTKHIKKNQSQIFIYIKLSTTTGFCWLFGFLATITDLDGFWYLFIIFMSLEGLFIFCSFFCTKRVKSLYVHRFGRKHAHADANLNNRNSGKVYSVSGRVERQTSHEHRGTFRQTSE